MNFIEFIDKSVFQNCHYHSQIDFNDEKIRVFLEDGNRIFFTYDEWFYLLETANQIIKINDELMKRDQE